MHVDFLGKPVARAIPFDATRRQLTPLVKQATASDVAAAQREGAVNANRNRRRYLRARLVGRMDGCDASALQHLSPPRQDHAAARPPQPHEAPSRSHRRDVDGQGPALTAVEDIIAHRQQLLSSPSHNTTVLQRSASVPVLRRPLLVVQETTVASCAGGDGWFTSPLLKPPLTRQRIIVPTKQTGPYRQVDISNLKT